MNPATPAQVDVDVIERYCHQEGEPIPVETARPSPLSSVTADANNGCRFAYDIHAFCIFSFNIEMHGQTSQSPSSFLPSFSSF